MDRSAASVVFVSKALRIAIDEPRSSRGVNRSMLPTGGQWANSVRVATDVVGPPYHHGLPAGR